MFSMNLLSVIGAEINPCIRVARGLSFCFSRRCWQNRPRFVFLQFSSFQKKKKERSLLVAHLSSLSETEDVICKETYIPLRITFLTLFETKKTHPVPPKFIGTPEVIAVCWSLVDIDCGYIRRVHRFRFCFYGKHIYRFKIHIFFMCFFFLYEIICRWYFFNSVL